MNEHEPKPTTTKKPRKLRVTPIPKYMTQEITLIDILGWRPKYISIKEFGPNHEPYPWDIR